MGSERKNWLDLVVKACIAVILFWMSGLTNLASPVCQDELHTPDF